MSGLILMLIVSVLPVRPLLGFKNKASLRPLSGLKFSCGATCSTCSSLADLFWGTSSALEDMIRCSCCFLDMREVKLFEITSLNPNFSQSVFYGPGGKLSFAGISWLLLLLNAFLGFCTWSMIAYFGFRT